MVEGMDEQIGVLVADDSPFICRLLVSYLQTAPDFRIVGMAHNGVSTVEMIKQLHPQVVTLDLGMPDMNGMEALEQVMHECPTPIVVVSGISRQAANTTLQALEAGAVDFIFKYTPGLDTDPEALRAEIIAKVRAAAKIRVIRSLRHRPTDKPLLAVTNLDTVKEKAIAVADVAKDTVGKESLLARGVLVIGASTGGPLALRELLSNIPADFPLPILIVQHMPAAFTKVLAAQLDRALPLAVREAKQGDHLEAGLVLIAPGGYHMLINSDLQIRLTQGPEVEGHRPSVDVTMQSVVQIYGARTKGVLLTGMGKDGCMGLSFIRAKGGKTFVQDEASCVVNGMPQKAIDMGVVDHIAPPAEIGKLLVANQRLPYIKNYA